MSNDINTTEDMLALGLESHMVGDFGVNGDGPVGKPVPTQYLADFHRVRDVSSDYFTLEKLVSLRPDFLLRGMELRLAGRDQPDAHQPGNVRDQDPRAERVLRHVEASKQTVSIDDTYQDITNLGEISSGWRARQKLIASMAGSRVASAQSKVTGLPPVSVLDYDSGTSAPFTGAGLAMPSALISLGGGRNIFAGLKQSWTTVSWEQVVAADPQCIIINNYGTPTAAQKERFFDDNTDPSGNISCHHL